MKQTKSTPGNRAFFAEHGRSLSAYGLIGFLGQSLSGLSLAYAVFALLVAQVFAGGEVSRLSFAALVAMAVVVGLFVELANRVLARRAIRPFVVKDLFADDETTARRHKILNRSYLVGLVAVALLSYFFSIVGSTYYADDATDAPELVAVDSIRTVYADQELTARRSFAADSATVATPYDVQLMAARSGFVADSSALMRDWLEFTGCARKGNKWCKKNLRRLLTEIDTKRAALSGVVASVTRERSAALAAALKARDERLTEIRAGLLADVSEAKATNTAANDERDGDAGFKGMVFIVLTVAGQTLFYFVIFLQLQVEAGSEIEHDLEPNEFWTLPTIIEEFQLTAAWRIERGARRLIRWIFGEPNDDDKTAIPYGSLYAKNDGDGDDGGAVTNGPVMAVKTAVGDGTTIVVDTAIKQCRNCGKDFRPKAHNHAYCATSCKSDYHTKKNNGRAFDPGKYRGRKSSKA